MKKRRKSRARGQLPKGAYSLPTGGYVVSGRSCRMPNGRSIRIVAVHRDPPNYELLAKAFLALAIQVNDERTQSNSGKG